MKSLSTSYGTLSLRQKRRIDGESAGLADQKRVAVGRRLGDGFGADDVAAPPLFSTMTCWPQALVSAWASARPTTSVTPPGTEVTTSVTDATDKPAFARALAPAERQIDSDKCDEVFFS